MRQSRYGDGASRATKDLPSSDERILRFAQDDKTPGLGPCYSDRLA
jgi:hypothetical protein